MNNIFRLWDSSAQLTHFLEVLGEGFGFIDQDENFIIVNQITADIFGYTKEELVGTNLSKYMSKKEYAKILQQTANRREGKVNTYFHTIIRKDGALREIQSTVSPYFEKGIFKGSYGVIRDLTEILRDKQQLEESEKRFRTVSDVISDFAVSFTIAEDNSFIPEWHSGLLPLRNIEGASTILNFNTWISSCHPDDMPILSGALEKVMKEREPATFEYRILTGEERYEWYEIFANPEPEQNTNRIGRVIVAGKNITEKKNATIAHQVTYSLVNSVNLASTVPTIFSAIHHELKELIDCTYLYLSIVNKGDTYLTCYSTVDNQSSGKLLAIENSFDSMVLRSGQPVLLDKSQILDLEKQELNHWFGKQAFCWAGIPLKIGDEIIGILSVSSFETEKLLSSYQFDLLVFIAPHIALTLRRKQDEDALRTSEAHLKESNLSKDKFFSIIAHDLRGPFNAIIGFSDLLYNDFESLDISEQRTMIKNIHDASLGTFKLLENLLEWSRIQTGRTKPNPENIDLSTISNSSLNFLKPQAEKKNIKLFSGIHFGTIAYCDEYMITTVIRNLISNAIKFTQHGGNIRIWSNTRENFVEITVADNGTGIPKEIIPKLFSLGETVKTRGTAGEQGTGLGLLLCREFVELNHGTISVSSEPGKGSLFTITLPKQIQ